MKTTLLKLSTLFALLVFVSIGPVMAQKKNSKPSQKNSTTQTQNNEAKQQQQRAKQFEETCLRLKLTPEQDKQMRALMKQSRNEIKALKEANKDKTQEEKQRLITEQLQKTDAQVNAILTAEQQVTWKQIKQERKAQMIKNKKEKDKHAQHKDAGEMEGIEELL